MKMKNKNMNKILKFIRYSLVGGICAIIDMIVYTIAFKFFNINYLLALFISFTITAALSFILHKRFTFKNKSEKYIKQLTTFLIIIITSITLNFLLMYFLVGKLLIYPILARAITLFIMWTFNFTLHNFITFKEKKIN